LFAVVQIVPQTRLHWREEGKEGRREGGKEWMPEGLAT
jgi:hypothetical protein